MKNSGSAALSIDHEEAIKDVIELIHFTEFLSAKIQVLRNEFTIFSTIVDEFKKTKRYTASIVLLTEDGKKLQVGRNSLPSRTIASGEKACGLRLSEYCIDLKKSRFYQKVIYDGATIQVKVSDIIAELFPSPLAHIISKITGYDKKLCIITPLKKFGKCIGAFAMSSTALGEYLIASVRYFVSHLSVALELAEESVERAKAEESLKASQELLETEQKALAEKNIALKEVLQQVESEKKSVEHHFAKNVERILLPIIEKLRKKSSGLEKEYINLLEKNLKDIASPFLEKLSVKYSRLTPRELEVSNMIKNGLSSKEIAGFLNISTLTVHRYREYIRKKMGIANKNINLASYLHTDSP